MIYVEYARRLGGKLLSFFLLILLFTVAVDNEGRSHSSSGGIRPPYTRIVEKRKPAVIIR